MFKRKFESVAHDLKTDLTSELQSCKEKSADPAPPSTRLRLSRRRHSGLRLVPHHLVRTDDKNHTEGPQFPQRPWVCFQEC